jgi:aryl-alcohol dehydrogenase-like predicted oxidoreductase
METVTLGMTDLEVSRIGFGAWELGGEWGSVGNICRHCDRASS